MSEMQSAPAPTRGVVFVHGLGDQRESETVVLFGRALVDWLYEWHTARGRKQDFAIDRTDLAFWPFDRGTSGSHPFTRVRVKPNEDKDAELWVLTEAWWSASLVRPDFWFLVGYFIRYIQRACGELFQTVVRRLKRHWHYPDSTDPGRWAWLVDWINSLVTAVVYLVVGYVGMSLVLPIVLLSRLPVPALQSLAFGSVLDSLVQIQIGEFYTYLNDRLQAANMRRQVAASINWLVKNQHCESVSVIAHSGGCDIAFGALTDLALKQAGALLEPEVLKRVNKLITFGSSLNHSWLLAPTVQVGCLPEHIHWLDIWSAYDSVPGKWPNPPSGVTVFKPSEHLVRAQGLLARPAADPSTANGDPTPARVSEDGAGVEWVRVTRKGQKLPDGSRANNDTYTWVPVTYDPRGRYWPVSEEVTNRMIVLIDHGLYWSNSEQVLVRFASEIDADFYQRSRFWRGDAGYVANSAMRIQGRTANLQQAVRDRRTRVSLLAAGRLLFGLLALAVAVVIAMLGFTSPDGEIGKFVLDYLFGTILNVLTGPVGNFFNWLASIVPPWLAGVVGFLRAAPVYVAGSIIVDLPAFTCGRSSATDSTVRTRTGAASPSTRSQPRRPDRPLVRSSVMPNTHFG